MPRRDRMDSITAFQAAALLDTCRQELTKGIHIEPSVIVEHRDELVAYAKCEELSSLLKDIKYFEERKAHLSEKRIELKTLPSKKEYTLAEAELQHITTRLLFSEKRLYAKLLKNPLIASNIEKIESTSEEFGNTISQALREMRAQGTFSVLQDKSNSLVSFKQRRDEFATKAKQTRESVCDLQKTLRSERAHGERVSALLELETSQVMHEISQLRDGTCDKTKMHRADMEEKVAATYRNIQQEECSMKSDIDKLQRLIKKEECEHKEKVEQIKRDIKQLEVESTTQRQRRAEEADGKAAELTKVKSKRHDNLNLLVDLQRRWDRDEAEAKRIEDQQEEDRRMRLEQEAETDRQRLAVAKIQVSYRLYLKKKAKVAAGAKRKKSKKGKGKKK